MHATLVALRVLDLAVALGEQRVVLAATDVLAGVELGSALTHEDSAGSHDHAVEALAAKALADRVTTVTGSTRTLLVCHERTP